MKPIIDWIMDHRIHILLAVLLSVAVLVNVGCATNAQAQAPAYIDTSGKEVIAIGESGVVFIVPGQEYPWVCRPDSATVVSCDSNNHRYLCEFSEAPEFFARCTDNGLDVPMGITIIESGAI